MTGRISIIVFTTSALAAGAVAMRIAWHDLRALPVPVAGGATGVMAGRILYAGGTAWEEGVKKWLRHVQQYDLATESWSAGPELPEPLAYGAFVSSNDAFEIFGGQNEDATSTKSWRLERNAIRWTETGVLPQKTILARAEWIDGFTYLFGGCADANLTECSASVWRRGKQGNWTQVSQTPDGPIALRASAVANGRAYLFGGCTGGAEGVRNRDEACRYDPPSNTWRRLRPLPEPARAVAASVIDSHRILLVGGYIASTAEAASQGPTFGFSDRVWIYDTDLDRYEPAGALPFAVAGIAIAAQGNAFYAMGGEDRMRGRSPRLLKGIIP